MHNRFKQGFTLLEMVMVIILLGILGLATTSYLQTGVTIYRDSTGRLELIDNARFAMERLNRELRNALPNSARTQNSGNCIQFVPIRSSSTYIELPIYPMAASASGTLVTPNSYSWQDGDELAVYIISADEAYGTGSKIHPITGATDEGSNTTSVTFDGTVQFDSDSPSQRFYIINSTVSWCVDSDQLIRTETDNSGDSISLMAQGIEQNSLIPFEVSEATLTRNALITAELRFINQDEEVTFHYEVQIPNQP